MIWLFKAKWNLQMPKFWRSWNTYTKNLTSLKQTLLLSSCLVDTERPCWANAQCSRKKTLATLGLPECLTNNEAEKRCVVPSFSKDFNVNKEDLEVSHWLKDKEQDCSASFESNNRPTETEYDQSRSPRMFQDIR